MQINQGIEMVDLDWGEVHMMRPCHVLTNAIETTVITDICFIPIGGMKRWTD
jgi:hypothetical protein